MNTQWHALDLSVDWVWIAVDTCVPSQGTEHVLKIPSGGEFRPTRGPARGPPLCRATHWQNPSLLSGSLSLQQMSQGEDKGKPSRCSSRGKGLTLRVARPSARGTRVACDVPWHMEKGQGSAVDEVSEHMQDKGHILWLLAAESQPATKNHFDRPFIRGWAHFICLSLQGTESEKNPNISHSVLIISTSPTPTILRWVGSMWLDEFYFAAQLFDLCTARMQRARSRCQVNSVEAMELFGAIR